MRLVKNIFKILLILLGLIFTFGSEDSFKTTLSKVGDEKKQTIKLAYVNWDSESVVTHVMGEALTAAGYNVELVPVDNAVMWSSVASGEADAFAIASLPKTHVALYEEYGSQLDNLDINVENVRTGLVVPTYMEVDSIEDLTDEASQVITGIEPGAGQTEQVNQVIEKYPNMEGWTQQTSSAGAMVTALDQAISKNEDIIVSGWTPHWKFEEYDLKFLEDPKQIFSQGEALHSMTRKGFSKDYPQAAQVMTNFSMTVEEVQGILIEVNNGTTIPEASGNWVEQNPDRIAEWISV